MARTTAYAPRTISLVTELLHPALQPDPSAIQRVHDQLFRLGSPPYSSFVVSPSGPALSNPSPVPGSSSFAAFRHDRFHFCEELSSVTYDEFAARVRSVAEKVAAQRGLAFFTAQQVTLRTLVNPRAFKDSRAYLKNAMFGFDDETDVFGVEPALLGIRFVFPPTPDRPGSHSLRIESWANDPRSLFLEVVSTYGGVRADAALVQVEENIHQSYRFLTEPAMRFVAGFDTRGGDLAEGEDETGEDGEDDGRS
ncbi:MAG: hypothetical protein JNK02_16055 [Planctomycetes bacterium]|nr:hypothetical protein [Planctomycetota bacterium]